MTIVEKGIALKLFAGFQVNSELKMHLQASPVWKEYQITEANAHGLKLIHFEDKNYLGLYIEPAIITLPDVDTYENTIRRLLERLFPKYNSDELSLYFFAQAFIQ